MTTTEIAPDLGNLGAHLVGSPDDLLGVDPGASARFALPVARRASGENLTIAVHVKRGVNPGPTLGLVGAVHGDAAWGSHVVRTAFEAIDASTLSGTVMAVPVANPVAFESATRTTGQGWNTDMNNMNRVFPGSRTGWITQKMAAAISENVIPHIDALIDYHCGSDHEINYTLVNGDRTPKQKRIFDYTRLMGTEFIYVHDADPFVGTIDQYTKSLGKLSIVAEQGGNVMPDGFHELSLTRVDNFLKGLGMLEGPPDLPKSQLLMRGERTIQRIEHGGIFYPTVGLEGLASVVPGGTVMSRVVDPHSFETVQEIVAPYELSALCQTRTQFGRVNPGDYAYIISDASKAEEIGYFENWRLTL